MAFDHEAGTTSFESGARRRAAAAVGAVLQLRPRLIYCSLSVAFPWTSDYDVSTEELRSLGLDLCKYPAPSIHY